MLDRAPFEAPKEDQLPRLLELALQKAEQPVKRGGVSFWTDAAILTGVGIPTVVFGPGGEGMRSPREYVRLNDVLACRDTLVELTRAFCV
jgi:acetylornithine deacetylase